MEAKQRIEELTAAALAVAERDGWAGLRRDAIAVHAGVTGGLVTVKLGTMTDLRRRVMRAAIQQRAMRVLAEGLAANDKCARRMPDELKREVALWLAQR